MTTTVDTPTVTPSRPAQRLMQFGLAVLVYDLAMSVVAWLAQWPPQLGGNPDPDQSYLGYLLGGSAISAPPAPLIVLLLGIAASRRRGAWRAVGSVLIAVVAAMFTMGVVGEFVAEHPHTPLPVVYIFGVVRLAIVGALLVLAVRQWRHDD